MADELIAAIEVGFITEDVVARHSKWCNTGGSWAAGMDAARTAARAMYGTVPERLKDSEDRPTDRYEEGLADVAAAMQHEWEPIGPAPVDPKLPATRRRATGEAVSTEEARSSWAVAAREVLGDVARTYNATITYADLADEVQARTGIVTQQLMRNWIGDVLGRVSDACADADEPLVPALCVQATGVVGGGYGGAVARATGSLPDDLQMHAAEERLRCYQHFDADLPEGGGRATLTRQEEARRTKARLSHSAPAKRAVCPTCFTQFPLTGICDACD